MLETYVIHTTKECNMNCTYCYEKDKTSKYTWEEVKEYINKLIDNRTSDVFNIEFLGGEPLMAFDIIKNTVEYIKDTFSCIKIHYTITTNGTILTEDILQFLKQHSDIITFGASMDGNISANQLRLMKSGINSHDLVINNMKTLISNDISNYIHIVAHPYNVAYIKDSINHLYSLGIRNIAVGIVETTIDIDEHFINRYIHELNKVSDDIRNGKYPGLYISELEQLNFTSDIRTYIYDDSGKIVGETYGRSGADITSTDEYKVTRPDYNHNSKFIIIARKAVFDYHKSNQ